MTSESWIPPKWRTRLATVAGIVGGGALGMSGVSLKIGAAIAVGFVLMTYDAYHTGYEKAHEEKLP